MMTVARPRRIWGLRVVLFLVFTMVLVIGGAYLYRRQVRDLQRERYEDLATIGQLKLDRLVAWRSERLGDARAASSGIARDELLRWLANPADPRRSAALHDYFTVLSRSYGYQNVILAAPDGRLLFSLDAGLGELDPTARRLIDQVLVSGEPALGDFFRCQRCHHVHIDVVAPIVDPNRNARGVVILRSDPSVVIYPVIQSWPTTSLSAETLLVRRDGDQVLYLNTLRHRTDAALSLRSSLAVRERPAVQAVLGKTGLTSGLDYRGVEVIASLHPVTDSPWFLVAKVDADELLAEARYRSQAILTFSTLGIVMAGLALLLTFYIGRAQLRQDLLGLIKLAGPTESIVPGKRREIAAKWSRVAGIAVLLIGIAALLGWLTGIERLKTVLPGYVAIKANTALGLASAGAALALGGSDHPVLRNLSRGLAGLVTLIGLATLIEYGVHADLGIDQLLFTESPDAIGTLSPGRMAPATAANFVIQGVALYLLQSRLRASIAQRLALVTGVVGLLPLVGYLYGAKSLYGVGSLTQLAIHTALAFVISSLGILLVYPGEGLMRTIMANTLGGWLLRRLIPVAVALPFLLGWLRVQGERLGAFENSLGVALLVMTLTLLLAATIWWTGDSLTHLDAVRSRAERLVMEKAEEIRATLYGIGDGVITTDANGAVTRLNPVAEQLTGWSENEAIGNPLETVFHVVNESTSATVESPVSRVLREGRIDGLASHTVLVSRAGTERPIADSGAPIRGPDGQIRGVILVFRDLSAERASESAVRQAEGNFVASFHGSPVAMVITSVDTQECVDVNDVFLRDSGFSRDEVLGHTAKELRVFVNPLDRERMVEAVTRDGHADNLEVELRTKAGDVRTSLMSTGLIRLGGVPHFLSSILDITARKRAEEDLRGALVESRRLLEIADKSRSALLSIMEDQKLEAERRKELEEQLHQAQKMEGIGRLAGGVAHDFNNLVSVIQNNTLFAMNGIHAGNLAGSLADLAEVQKASGRAAALTQQLLAFSRRQVLQPVPLDLNEVLLGLQMMLRRLLREDIDLRLCMADDLGFICADPTQMEQVIMNLVVNAGDAMPSGGKVTLETSNVHIDEVCMVHHVEIRPGDYVQLVVTDTGSGMDAETKDRIFEPFFTTKEAGRGTGLGLSTVYGIVKQSSGSIWVYSELGRGSTFKLYFPRIEQTTANRPSVHKVSRPSGGTETVLVAEDEPALRIVVKRALETAGYEVLLAANSDEALNVSARFSSDIHLLLTDVVMPGLNGRALADELEKRRPGIAVLFMSGYTDDAIVQHGVLEPGTQFIAKPFTAPDLTAKVREVLDQRLVRSDDPPVEGAAIADAEPDRLEFSALVGLPRSLRGELRRTLVSARYDELVQVVDAIRPLCPALCSALERRIERYDYKEILMILAQIHEDDAP